MAVAVVAATVASAATAAVVAASVAAITVMVAGASLSHTSGELNNKSVVTTTDECS